MVQLLALVLAPVISLAQASVHVVDPDGGADFTHISSAVAAAASGDIVLLRSGNYFDNGQGVFVGAGKSLAIVAEAGTAIEAAALDVQGLGAANHLLVQGLQLETIGGSVDRVFGCAGPVWLERCGFVHTLGGIGSLGGVSAVGSASVVFARCELGPPVDLLFDDGNALAVFASRVHLHASTVLGLDELTPAVQLLQGSFLELEDAALVGAPGVDGSLGHCDGFDGGTALLMRDASHGRSLGSTIEGGAGGAPQAGTGCSPGLDGFDALLVGGSTLDSRPGGAKRLELASPVRDDEFVQVTVRGAPGERAWIVYASQPMPGQAANAHEGELLVGAPRQTVPLGTLPASGTLVVQVAAPTLPPGTEGAVFFSQALVKDSVTGRFVLSSPSALVVLDDSL